MSDLLEVVRAPVPVGTIAPPAHQRPRRAHPSIDARAVLARSIPRPAARPEPRTWTPPDPLGVLDPVDPLDRALTPTEPTPSRRGLVLVAVAAIALLVAGGLVVLAGDRGDDGAAGDDLLVAPTALATTPPETGSVLAGEVAWGPDPGVCPDDESACYTVAVELLEFEPGRQVAVECVVGDRLGPGPRTVTIGADSPTRTRVPCAEDRSARSIDVTVDGVLAAVVELPTTIVPRATVTFTTERPAEGQADCSTPACRYLDVVLTGFEPGTEVLVSCHSSSQGQWSISGTVTIGPDGTATDGHCYFGYPGEEVWVEAGEIRSETLVWPG